MLPCCLAARMLLGREQGNNRQTASEIGRSSRQDPPAVRVSSDMSYMALALLERSGEPPGCFLKDPRSLVSDTCSASTTSETICGGEEGVPAGRIGRFWGFGGEGVGRSAARDGLLCRGGEGSSGRRIGLSGRVGGGGRGEENSRRLTGVLWEAGEEKPDR